MAVPTSACYIACPTARIDPMGMWGRRSNSRDLLRTSSRDVQPPGNPFPRAVCCAVTISTSESTLGTIIERTMCPRPAGIQPREQAAARSPSWRNTTTYDPSTPATPMTPRHRQTASATPAAHSHARLSLLGSPPPTYVSLLSPRKTAKFSCIRPDECDRPGRIPGQLLDAPRRHVQEREREKKRERKTGVLDRIPQPGFPPSGMGVCPRGIPAPTIHPFDWRCNTTSSRDLRAACVAVQLAQRRSQISLHSAQHSARAPQHASGGSSTPAHMNLQGGWCGCRGPWQLESARR